MTGVQTCALPISSHIVLFKKADESEEDEDTQEDNSEDTDYSKMSVAELKELLKEKKLPVSGKKAELIERLQGDSK